MPKSNHRTSYIALELGEALNATDIRLLGTVALVNAGDSLARNLQTNLQEPSDEHTFKDFIGAGYRCHYMVEEIESGNPQDDTLRCYERGVGSIRLEGRNSFLKRELPIFTGVRRGYEKPCSENDTPHEFINKDCYLRVSSYIPKTYLEALYSPHSVIASREAFHPHAIELEEACVLGRLNNEVQSIDMDELVDMIGFSSAISSSLSKSQKQLNMKARHIVLDRKNAKVAASSLQDLPVYSDSEKPPPQTGMIIFTTDKLCLEFFDGQDWKALIWENKDESTS